MKKLKDNLMHEVSSFRTTNKIKTDHQALSKIEGLGIDKDITERADRLINEIESDDD